MKTLCVLAVVVVAVAASPDCSSYCDKLFSGWILVRRSDCDCEAPQKELQDGPKYEHDLKSILLPGYLPSEIKHNKVKRSSRTDVTTDEAIPVERTHNFSTTSKSPDEVFNNSQISETNLSDCIDLLISISIRKNKKKNIANLGPSGLEKNNNLNDLEINTEIKNKCDQASAIIKQSVEEIIEHQKNISKKKNQNVDVAPKLDMRSAFEWTDEDTPATSTNDDKDINSTVKNTPYDKHYTNAITTNDNTTILESTVKDFNLSTRLEDNNQEETNKNHNLKNINSVEVSTKDDGNTTNLIVNNTSTKLKNIQTTIGNMSSLPYNLKNVQKNNLNYELTSKKSQSPLTLSERVRNESMLMADYSDNVKESTSILNQYTTNSNKTVFLKTINQNENYTSLRDRYKENVPIVSIITREYPNDTISSIVNGTETLTYSKFEEEAINNNNTENTSDSRLLSIESELEIRSGSDDTPSTSEEQSSEIMSEIMSPTINGRLFFEYKQEHIPGHFVQTQDGRLQLSLDMNTICDELIQKWKQNSLLISNLCQYLIKRNQSMGYGI